MKTLILNADNKPLSIVDFKRAVVLAGKNSNITALSYYDKKLISSNGEIKIPAVMVYSKYIRISYRKFPSKRAIRIRDKNKCAYCGINLQPHELTIDHIIPVSRFKDKALANTWENQVSCCLKCNSKKGNKTPSEANMKLLTIPRRVDILFLVDNIPKEWDGYIS